MKCRHLGDLRDMTLLSGLGRSNAYFWWNAFHQVRYQTYQRALQTFNICAIPWPSQSRSWWGI